MSINDGLKNTRVANAKDVDVIKQHVDSFSDKTYPDQWVIPIEYSRRIRVFEFANYGEEDIEVEIQGLTIDIKAGTVLEFNDATGFTNIIINGYEGMIFLCLVAL